MPETAEASLKAEQEQTLATPTRRYSVAAKVLFKTLEFVYGGEAALATFRVVEIIARVPYQAWENVAYVAITHTSEHPNLARRIYGEVAEARAQQDNEQWHLLILEELLQHSGHRRRLFRDLVIPQVLALVYYQLSWLLYVIRPEWSYRLNVDFEDHAEHLYMEWVRDNPDFDETPWEGTFAKEYGSHRTLGDLFRQIGLDERHHKQQSLDRMAHPRFD